MYDPSENAAADIAAHLHSFTNLAAHPEVGPLVITKGDGVFVEDDKGNRYLEAVSALWCASLGLPSRSWAQAA